MPGFDDDTLLAWEQTPPQVRAAIVRRAGGLSAGHAIWRCPRRKRGGWFRPGTIVIEYWWLDESGELVEAYWFE